MRWTAPELLDGGRPTKENDVYSFGCVMFHVSLKSANLYPLLVTVNYTQVLTLDIPWHTITDDCQVHENILKGECILRPATSDAPDMTDARWNVTMTCWSAQGSRPSAPMATNFLMSELEALSGDVGSFMFLFLYC
jgi:serine/threonine protein kinase